MNRADDAVQYLSKNDYLCHVKKLHLVLPKYFLTF